MEQMMCLERCVEIRTQASDFWLVSKSMTVNGEGNCDREAPWSTESESLLDRQWARGSWSFSLVYLSLGIPSWGIRGYQPQVYLVNQLLRPRRKLVIAAKELLKKEKNWHGACAGKEKILVVLLNIRLHLYSVLVKQGNGACEGGSESGLSPLSSLLCAVCWLCCLLQLQHHPLSYAPHLSSPILTFADVCWRDSWCSRALSSVQEHQELPSTAAFRSGH